MKYDPYEELEAAIYQKACEDYVNYFFARPDSKAHYLFKKAERYILSDENMVQKTIPGKEMVKILAKQANEKYGKNKRRWKEWYI